MLCVCVCLCVSVLIFIVKRSVEVHALYLCRALYTCLTTALSGVFLFFGQFSPITCGQNKKTKKFAFGGGKRQGKLAIRQCGEGRPPRPHI